MGKTFRRYQRFLAEAARLHLVLQPPAGGRHQPHVGAQGQRSAHALELPVLDHAGAWPAAPAAARPSQTNDVLRSLSRRDAGRCGGSRFRTAAGRGGDIDVHHHGGYHGCCCYYSPHPVATAAAVTATAIVTAAVVVSIVNTLPPNCATVVVNGFAYRQCGSTWYQPQISGSTTTYIVVNPPR